MSGKDRIDYCPVDIAQFCIKQIYFSILHGIDIWIFGFCFLDSPLNILLVPSLINELMKMLMCSLYSRMRVIILPYRKVVFNDSH